MDDETRARIAALETVVVRLAIELDILGLDMLHRLAPRQGVERTTMYAGASSDRERNILRGTTTLLDQIAKAIKQTRERLHRERGG